MAAVASDIDVFRADSEHDDGEAETICLAMSLSEEMVGRIALSIEEAGPCPLEVQWQFDSKGAAGFAGAVLQASAEARDIGPQAGFALGLQFGISRSEEDLDTEEGLDRLLRGIIADSMERGGQESEIRDLLVKIRQKQQDLIAVIDRWLSRPKVDAVEDCERLYDES